jgi:hypothetical protein
LPARTLPRRCPGEQPAVPGRLRYGGAAGNSAAGGSACTIYIVGADEGGHGLEDEEEEEAVCKGQMEELRWRHAVRCCR